MERVQSRARRLRLLALGVMAAATLSTSAGLMSLALFTDDEDVTGDFTTLTVDLTASPTALFNVTDLMPGDTKTAALTITNSGTAELRYAMTSASTTNDSFDLADVATLTIREKATGTCAADFTGTVLVNNHTFASAAIGDPAQGAQTGDRTLAASANDQLCVRVSLPLSTGNDYQGVSASLTFTFSGEQTANNP
jgi:spore coat-associated protein N